MEESSVCVIGGGIVGTSVTLALARRGVDVLLVEAEPELALAASGTNSGILHTGFDSPPNALETRLLLRSTELREELIAALDPPIIRAQGLLRPHDERERAAVDDLMRRAVENGVPLERQPDGSLLVPGEAVTDPVSFALSLAGAAENAGARVTCGTRIDSIEQRNRELVFSSDSEPFARCRLAVNCAGLYADAVARAAGDDNIQIVPRKGEFFVFEPPGGRPLEQILLSVPTAKTKGVLVFPSVDRKVIAGPTAIDQEDKRDWSVRPEAFAEVIGQASRLLPELKDAEPIASYAGLRTAGAGGANYVIERSHTCPQLLHVAAIRSTGLSASPGIAEHATNLLAEMGLKLGPVQPLEPAAIEAPSEPWWRRSARHWAASAA